MKIGMIGYGNVGQHLVIALSQNPSHSIVVYNRSSIAESDQLDSVTYSSHTSILDSVEVLFIAVKDEAIIEILERIENVIPKTTLVCHCAGSISSTVIEPYFTNFGVLYPLQTMSKLKEVKYNEIPLFVTSSSPESEAVLKELAFSITPKVEVISDQQRLSMHIAAVFACNYVNAMYEISHRLCQEFDISFDVLKPLILETADKINFLTPKEAQTGPAIRRDWEIIYKHEEFLQKYDPHVSQVYRLMADYITKKH